MKILLSITGNVRKMSNIVCCFLKTRRPAGDLKCKGARKTRDLDVFILQFTNCVVSRATETLLQQSFSLKGPMKLCLLQYLKIKSKSFVQQLPSQAFFQRKTCHLRCFRARLIWLPLQCSHYLLSFYIPVHSPGILIFQSQWWSEKIAFLSAVHYNVCF